MTPAQGWTESAYFAASRAARRACEARSEQLQIVGVLDSEAVKRAEARRTPAAAASVSSPPLSAAVADSPRGGLAVPAEETGAQPSLASPATEAHS